VALSNIFCIETTKAAEVKKRTVPGSYPELLAQVTKDEFCATTPAL